GEWVSYDIPLTAFDGVDLADVIQLKFDGGEGSETIYLDNLYFYKTPTSISDISQDQLTVYPNPVRSGQMILLGTQVKQVEVFDVTGKLIQSLENTSSVETNTMDRGVYFMRIKTENDTIQINQLIVQ
ncbi:MAG: T9SS type A sorting domain-containing protein, partial [Bacteroidota bacterium]